MGVIEIMAIHIHSTPIGGSNAHSPPFRHHNLNRRRTCMWRHQNGLDELEPAFMSYYLQKASIKSQTWYFTSDSETNSNMSIKGDLSSSEKELLDVIATGKPLLAALIPEHCWVIWVLLFSFAISPGNVQEASRLLGCKDVRVNCLDEVREHKCSKFCWFDMQKVMMMLIYYVTGYATLTYLCFLFSNECSVDTFIEKRH